MGSTLAKRRPAPFSQAFLDRLPRRHSPNQGIGAEDDRRASGGFDRTAVDEILSRPHTKKAAGSTGFRCFPTTRSQRSQYRRVGSENTVVLKDEGHPNAATPIEKMAQLNSPAFKEDGVIPRRQPPARSPDGSAALLFMFG